MGSLISILPQIYRWIWQCKNFENRLRINRLTAMSSVSPFLGTQLVKLKINLAKTAVKLLVDNYFANIQYTRHWRSSAVRRWPAVTAWRAHRRQIKGGVLIVRGPAATSQRIEAMAIMHAPTPHTAPSLNFAEHLLYVCLSVCRVDGQSDTIHHAPASSSQVIDTHQGPNTLYNRLHNRFGCITGCKV